MQVLSVSALNALETTAGDVAAPANNAAPNADAAEIGAFVATLLSQLGQNASNAVDPATAPAELAQPAADGGADLPPAGQDPAAVLPAMVAMSEFDSPPTQLSALVPAQPAAQATLAAAALGPLQPGPLQTLPSAVTSSRPGALQAALALSAPADGAGSRAAAPRLAELADENSLLPTLRVGREPATLILPQLAEYATVRAEGGPSAATPGAAAADPGAAASALGRGSDAQAMPAVLAGKAAALPAQQPEVFSERLNQHIAVMVSHNAQHARIAVNPAELGPVEVRVSVVGDEATVQLAAPTAATRELLEEALPRLRAAFADSGIALGNADVFTDMPERGDAGAEGEAQNGASSFDDGAAGDGTTPLRRVQLGLVDAFV